MKIYKDFVEVYRQGWYANHSLDIATIFPCLLADLGIQPTSLVDIACGMGDFAIEMAKSGIDTTGVDFSTQMLAIAKEKSILEKVSVTWLHQDMSKLKLKKKVDLATSWFDSLNYLIKWEDLLATFYSVNQALKDGGYFIFDMNTRFGLIENWNRFPCYVPQDTSKCFEVHQPSFDYEKNIASLKITAFLKEEEGWKRIQETHQERGYTLEEIRRIFQELGFLELHCFGSLVDRTPLKEDSGRVYFVLQKNQSVEEYFE
jgi:ubiquinone/menaquinone biosynthesis C-methylase UbiE